MNLSEFLVRAKKNSYASGKKARKLEDCSEEFIYQEENLRYSDRYFGNNPFFGQEVVFEKRDSLWIPRWGMNYGGRVFGGSVDVDKVYEFLREALKNVEERFPLRGPEYFRKGELLYHNACSGTLEAFCGVERISLNFENVYECNYHGGLIK